MTPGSGGSLEFDLHGIVGIRVVGARVEDRRAVWPSLGRMVGRLDGPPDITVHFVPRIHAPGLRYVEPGRAGFDDDGYIVLSQGRRPVTARIPFGEAGSPRVIECEHGARAVPMLEDWIRLVALEKGYVPLHASAFEYAGAGIVVAGGPHAGKTSCLLAFARHGARFVSDDLVFLDPDGGPLLGVPTEISVAGWQLDQLPGFERRLGPARRAVLAGMRRLDRVRSGVGVAAVDTVAHIAGPALRRRLKTRLSPGEVFGGEVAEHRTADAIFLALSHAPDQILVEPSDPGRMAARLAAGLRLQMGGLAEHYAAYRFAFPERRSELLEGAEATAERLLRRALADRSTFVLRHPHPVSFEGLRRVMEPAIQEARDRGVRARVPARAAGSPTPGRAV